MCPPASGPGTGSSGRLGSSSIQLNKSLTRLNNTSHHALTTTPHTTRPLSTHFTTTSALPPQPLHHPGTFLESTTHHYPSTGTSSSRGGVTSSPATYNASIVANGGNSGIQQGVSGTYHQNIPHALLALSSTSNNNTVVAAAAATSVSGALAATDRYTSLSNASPNKSSQLHQAIQRHLLNVNSSPFSGGPGAEYEEALPSYGSSTRLGSATALHSLARSTPIDACPIVASSNIIDGEYKVYIMIAILEVKTKFRYIAIY